MMKLKDDELAILNGEEGELRQEAMKFLVELGEANGAKEMIDVDYAFVYLAELMEGTDREKLPRCINPELLLQSAKDGVKVKVPTVGCVFAMDPDHWREAKISEKEHEAFVLDQEIKRQFGILPVATCSPYLVTDMDKMPLGTHMVGTESSSMPYYNSILGARVNRGGISSFFGALTGKYPAFGYHLDENRFADTLVKVNVPLKDLTDFGSLGYYVGKVCGLDVPVFEGLTDNITEPNLVSLSSALATGGAVTMFHIPGVSPESRTVEEALNGKKPKRIIEFGKEELASVYNKFHGVENEKINKVMIGCPHYTIHQLKDVAEKLEGKHISEDVQMIINIGPQTKFLAEQMGYMKIMEDAGLTVINGTCPMVWAGCPGPVYSYTHPEYSSGVMVTDSLKCAGYARSTLSASKIILASTEECFEAAFSGKWRTLR